MTTGSPPLHDFESLVDLDELMAVVNHETQDHLLLPDHLDDDEIDYFGHESPDSVDRKAVQIELQDNASLPTFQWKVDRSGSVPESARLKPPTLDDLFADKRHDCRALPDPTPLSDLQTKDQQFFSARREPLPIPDIPWTDISQNNHLSDHTLMIATTTTDTEKLSATAPKGPSATKKKPSPTLSRKQTPSKNGNSRGDGVPASIQKATSQKSKYGFGKKHIVTAVPGHVAYERKKQRAKDARIRLNESIDQLSLAMTIAGNASQQRKFPWRFMHDTQSSMTECAAIASDAKKWDRPSFVGSAAAMIQSLNAQCDVLMKELQHLAAQQQQLQQPSSSKRRRLEDEAVNDAQYPAAPKSDVDEDINTTSRRVPIGFTWPDNPLDSRVLQRIGSFLDPRSLARSARVCRAWKVWTSDCVLWEHIAIQRFGAIPVRQWNDKLEDCCNNSYNNNVYFQMDANNVMPHISSLPVASLSLGQVRLPHRFGAWVFLRQRSNGETLQSVLNPLTGLYSSMPIVQLWIVVQNTGLDEILIPRDQPIVVDASTRRRGEELGEVPGPRFQKRWWHIDGTTEVVTDTNSTNRPLRLFETIILEVNIHAHGCTTVAKFLQRSNYTKILFQQGETTVPVIIPFPRDSLKT